MSPVSQLEWGSDAFKIMQELKALIDPKGVLNPGVILNPSPNVCIVQFYSNQRSHAHRLTQ
jgi:hypothetical protein